MFLMLLLKKIAVKISNKKLHKFFIIYYYAIKNSLFVKLYQ